MAVKERRTAGDLAHQMQWLVDEAYPDVTAGGRGLPRCAGGPGGFGQPQYP